MKKIQYLFATIILGLGLTSCGDSFLTKYPEGGTLLEEQYQKLPDRLEGSLRGIYSALYAHSNHQTFGQRSIDMYGDIQSGDMAIKKTNYGWFEDYERGHFSTAARSYIWSYYYDVINLCNRCLVTVDQEAVQKIMDGIITDDPDELTTKLGYQYGQLLALRGWAYAGLLMYYCDPMDAIDDLDAELAFPLYTETEIKNPDFKGGPRATVTEVYDRVYQDLFEAVELLDYYGALNQRESKLVIDADVARIILAYSMLNHGHPEIIIRSSDNANAYDIALEYADAAISNGKYPMLKNAELLTTGFSDETAANWMWAEDVTVENTTALASFWGQVDIHTYSYAAAGDAKTIDANLYGEILANSWDGRVDWFRPIDAAKFALCPDGKFYNPKTKHTTDLDKVDRDWLCDNLFMRIEVAYLIAAEAAYRKGDDATAKSYLSTLCSERIADGKSTTDMQAWLDAKDTKDALVYNWRVEMWGEGYGLQTLRRLSKSVTLGDNHLSRGKQTLNTEGNESYMYQVEIPTSEIRYNPELAKTELTKAN